MSLHPHLYVICQTCVRSWGCASLRTTISTSMSKWQIFKLRETDSFCQYLETRKLFYNKLVRFCLITSWFVSVHFSWHKDIVYFRKKNLKKLFENWLCIFRYIYLKYRNRTGFQLILSIFNIPCFPCVKLLVWQLK